MKAIDFRNATFADLQGQLHGLRLTVLANLRAQGPATTRQLAERSGIDILSVRPRITELMTLGFVCLIDSGERSAESGEAFRNPQSSIRSREGVYRALTDAEAEAALLNKQAEPIQAQPELKL